MKRSSILVLSTSLIFGSIPSLAIEGLKLEIRCPDVVLSWPSTNGEIYIIQHRESLDPSSPWVTLANAFPASSTTNVTLFTHSNRVDCAAPQSFGLSYSSGTEGTAPQGTQTAKLTEEERKRYREQREAERLERLYAICKAEGREPYVWELENRPPLPWEAPENPNAEASASLQGDNGWGVTLNGSTSSQSGSFGFYRVVRNGVHLFGVTNGQAFEGVVEIPIEVSATNQSTPGINLFVNGIAAPVVEVVAGIMGCPVLRWDTRFTANGAYSLHAECDFAGSITRLVGTTNEITVTNLVRFDEFNSAFGEQMWVYAELAIPTAEYDIDIFAGDHYIGTFSGSTSDGLISFLWDLTDPFGNTVTNETIRGEFYAAAAGNPRTNKPSPAQWNKEHGWTTDAFAVAWSVTQKLSRPDWFQELMLGGVVNVLVGPGIGEGYTLSPGNTPNGTAFRLTAGSKTNLLEYLADPEFRNFYFYGHGNASSFGDYNEIQGWMVNISESELRAALTNYTPTVPAKHPYRFVFLDSCESANGRLPEAFGIARVQRHRQEYRFNDIKSRAFVGYTEADIPLPGDHNEVTFNSSMLAQFFADWRGGMNLYSVVNRAKQHQFWPMSPSVMIWGATNLFRSYAY